MLDQRLAPTFAQGFLSHCDFLGARHEAGRDLLAVLWIGRKRDFGGRGLPGNTKRKRPPQYVEMGVCHVAIEQQDLEYLLAGRSEIKLPFAQKYCERVKFFCELQENPASCLSHLPNLGSFEGRPDITG